MGCRLDSAISEVFDSWFQTSPLPNFPISPSNDVFAKHNWPAEYTTQCRNKRAHSTRIIEYEVTCTISQILLDSSTQASTLISNGRKSQVFRNPDWKSVYDMQDGFYETDSNSRERTGVQLSVRGKRTWKSTIGSFGKRTSETILRGHSHHSLALGSSGAAVDFAWSKERFPPKCAETVLLESSQSYGGAAISAVADISIQISSLNETLHTSHPKMVRLVTHDHQEADVEKQNAVAKSTTWRKKWG